MKRFMTFLGLLVFLAVAYFVQDYLQQSDEDQEVIEWANSLVWAAIGSQSSVKFLEPQVRAGDQPAHWTVSGQIALREGDGMPVEHAYSASVAQLCDSTERRECWRLEQLSIGGSAVDLTGLENELMQSGRLLATTEPESAPQPPAAAEPGNGAAGPPGDAGGTGAASQEMQPSASDDTLAAAPDAAQPGPEASEVAAVTPSGRADAPDSAAEAPPAPAAPTDAEQPQPSSERQQLIAAIQGRLRDLGYSPGPVDGLMGPQTKSAIETYQRNNSFAVTGEPSRQLLQLLERPQQ